MAQLEPVNRVVLVGNSQGGAPAVSDAFRQMLRGYDPDLLVSWNSLKRRFVIEQCVRHYAATSEHTHVCQRLYVLMAQDEAGVMVPLGEKVMDMIREKDTRKAGYGPGDLARFLRDQRRVIEADREDRSKKMGEVIRYGSRHNRAQLRKALHLIQQHDLRVNQ